MKIKTNLYYIFVVISFLLLHPSSSFAGVGDISNLVTRFAEGIENTGIKGTMSSYSYGIFGFLALLQFTWAMYQLALDGRMDIQAWVMAIVRQCVYFTFFYLIVTQGWDLLNGLAKDISQIGSSGGMTVTGIFTLGLDLARMTFDAAWEASSFSILDGSIGASLGGLIMAVFCIIIIVVAMTMAGINALVAQCKLYLVATVGVFALGFGGSTYTKDISINAIRSSIACGIELMVIYVLIGIANSVFTSFRADATTLQPEQITTFCLQMVCASLVFAGLLQTLPGYLATLFYGGGSGGGGGSAAMGMAAASMAKSAAVISVAVAGSKVAGQGLSLLNQATKTAQSPSSYLPNRNSGGSDTPPYVSPW